MSAHTIGDRIKALRKDNHLTQEDLGNLVGLHGSNIGRIEKGTIIPTADVIRELAFYFGVSCDEIIIGNSANMQNDYSPKVIKVVKNFVKLSIPDQDEILELIEFKLQRTPKMSGDKSKLSPSAVEPDSNVTAV